MNREILFRGKQIDNGEWVEGYPCAGVGIDAGKWFLIAVGRDYLNSHIYQVDPATIGQYTGLTDRNGQKIFEGDLVKFDRFTPYTDILEKVKFCEGGFAPFCVAGWECTPSWEECEVIGNIHDNPELMEGD